MLYSPADGRAARRSSSTRRWLVAQVAIGGIIFLIVLIIVHLITARISDTVLDSRVGAIDRVLGFAFGVVRGFVLVVIPYMFYESFVPNPEQQFPGCATPVSLPYIKSTGNSFRIMLAAPGAAASLMGAGRATAGLVLPDHNSRVAGRAVASGVNLSYIAGGPARPDA